MKTLVLDFSNFRKTKKNINKHLKEVFGYNFRFNKIDELYKIYKSHGLYMAYIYDYANNKIGNKPIVENGNYYIDDFN